MKVHKFRITTEASVEYALFYSKHTPQLEGDSKIEAIAPSFIDTIIAKQPVSISQKSDFFSNLERLIRSGLSIAQALSLSIETSKSPYLKGVLSDLYIRVKQDGLGLSDAMDQEHKDFFGEVTISILKTAETSGDLEETLKILVKGLESEKKIHSQVKSALSYPAAMLIFALISLFVILYFVLPKMQSTFEDMGANLPTITQFMLKISDIISNQTWILLTLLIIPIFFAKIFNKLRKTQFLENIIIRIPVVGAFIKEQSLLKAFQVLSILIKSGSSLPEAHAAAITATSLNIHKRFFKNIQNSLESGQNIYFAYLSGKKFLGKKGNEIAYLIKIGESSDSLSDMLGVISSNLEESVEIQAKLLPKFIQPISTALLFALIGLMAASIYIPQLQLVIQTMEKA